MKIDIDLKHMMFIFIISNMIKTYNFVIERLGTYNKIRLTWPQRMEEGDLETLFECIIGIFDEELEDDQREQLSKFQQNTMHNPQGKTLREIFVRDFVVTGIENLPDGSYKIQWGT